MATVPKQVAYLRRLQTSTTARRKALQELSERRRDHPELTQFGVTERPSGGESAHVMDQLLIRAEDRRLPGVSDILAEAGYSAKSVQALDNRVAVIQPASSVPSRSASDLVLQLRKLGARSSFNYVVPTQVVIKGPDGPDPVDPSFAAPSISSRQLRRQKDATTRISLVDTGITKQERTDRWLSTVPRRRNIDTLHDIDREVLDRGAGHGTFCAGIAQQLAPSVPVYVYKALDSEGVGAELAVAEAMVKAARDGLGDGQHVVLNVSLGVETVDDVVPLAMEVALDIITEAQAQVDQDVLVFAAAGNSGRERRTFPGALRDVVAVAALTGELSPAKWSSRGPWVDVSTVAEGVVSTYVCGTESSSAPSTGDADTFLGPNPWAAWSGTSFAAPQVAGTVAAMANKSGISPTLALERLLAGTPYLKNYGRVLRLL